MLILSWFVTQRPQVGIKEIIIVRLLLYLSQFSGTLISSVFLKFTDAKWPYGPLVWAPKIPVCERKTAEFAFDQNEID